MMEFRQRQTAPGAVLEKWAEQFLPTDSMHQIMTAQDIPKIGFL